MHRPLALLLALLTAVPCLADKRVAVVIGNSAYRHVGALVNPGNDARAMARALTAIGFTVKDVLDGDRPAMDGALSWLESSAKDADLGVFYYSGHGVQVDGTNFLLPVDAQPESAAQLRRAAISATEVCQTLAEGGCKTSVLILDACRDNPFARRFRSAATGGLARMDAAKDTLIAFAADAGEVADDNPREANGLYTQELLKHLGAPGLSIEEVFKRTRRGVNDRSNGKQTPAEYSRLIRDVYFVPKEAPPPPVTGGSDRSARIASARERAAEGRPKDALAEFQRAADENPNDAAAWAGVGAMRWNLGETAAGIAALKRALELDAVQPTAWAWLWLHEPASIETPGNPQSVIECARASFNACKSKRHDEAARFADMIPPKFASFAGVARLRADLELAREPDEAKRATERARRYREVAQKDPGDALGWFILSQVEESPDASVAALTRACEVEPALARAWEALASAHTRAKRWDAASDALVRCALANPAGRWWVRLVFTRDQTQEGAARLEARIRKITQEHPDLAPAWEALGQVILDRDRKPEALAAHRRAIALDPARPFSVSFLCAQLGPHGNSQEALAIVAKAVEAGKDAGDLAQIDSALEYLKTGESNPEVEALELAIARKRAALEPTARNKLDLAICLIGAGELREAEALVREARATHEADPEALAVEVTLFAKQGKVEEAQNAGRTLLGGEITDWHLIKRVSKIMEANGQRDLVAGAYERFLKVNRGPREAELELERLRGKPAGPVTVHTRTLPDGTTVTYQETPGPSSEPSATPDPPDGDGGGIAPITGPEESIKARLLDRIIHQR